MGDSRGLTEEQHAELARLRSEHDRAKNAKEKQRWRREINSFYRRVRGEDANWLPPD
ncbi:MAG: hypothetical protein AAGA99_12170 [Actinomycetota bacterium]